LQKPEGYWNGELMVDSTLVSDMVAIIIDAAWTKIGSAKRSIISSPCNCRRRLEHLSRWPVGSKRDHQIVSCAQTCRVRATGSRRICARAKRRCIWAACRDEYIFQNCFSQLIGLFPWEYVPTIPCEVLLIRKWFHVNFWDIEQWSRGMLVPLAIINHFKPTRPVNWTLDETLSRRHPRTRISHSRLTRKNFHCGIFVLWLDCCTNLPNGLPNIKSIHSANSR